MSNTALVLVLNVLWFLAGWNSHKWRLQRLERRRQRYIQSEVQAILDGTIPVPRPPTALEFEERMRQRRWDRN